jgi:CCR4-NOT transcription complex subunit 1
MVQSLTGSLALVTCKDPLRLSFSNHLRSLLQANNADPTQIDQAIAIVADDNIDFGCSIIEKAASERAVRQIDESLAIDFEVGLVACSPVLLSLRSVSHADASEGSRAEAAVYG